MRSFTILLMSINCCKLFIVSYVCFAIIDFVFFIAFSYPTRQQFDIIGMAIVSLLNLPATRETIVGFIESIVRNKRESIALFRRSGEMHCRSS